MDVTSVPTPSSLLLILTLGPVSPPLPSSPRLDAQCLPPLSGTFTLEMRIRLAASAPSCLSEIHYQRGIRQSLALVLLSTPGK